VQVEEVQHPLTVPSLPRFIQRLFVRGGVDEDDQELEAPAELPAEKPRSESTDETLALLYDEIRGALEAQHDHVESLNARAQQLLGFATIILAILAAIVPTHPSVGIRILYAIALLVFGVAAVLSALAWKIRGYRFDPSPLSLWDIYRLEDERKVREQVASNRRDSLADNEKEVERKLKRVKKAEKWLYVGFLYVAAVLIYQIALG
jgi:Na+/melibiose symporter-like transporter